MKNTIKVALFVLSCIPFAIQSRGLWIFNKTDQDISYKGSYSGIITRGNYVHFMETPTILSIKKGSFWTPVEMYLLKMHTQKKGMADRKGDFVLTGNLYITPQGITSEVNYRNVRTGAATQ